jgi:hypothetical protein
MHVVRCAFPHPISIPSKILRFTSLAKRAVQEHETESSALDAIKEASKKHRRKWVEVLGDKNKQLVQLENKREWLERKIKKFVEIKLEAEGDLTREEENNLRMKTILSTLKSTAAENKSINAYFSVEELESGLWRVQNQAAAANCDEVIMKFNNISQEGEHLSHTTEVMEEEIERMSKKAAAIKAMIKEMQYSTGAHGAVAVEEERKEGEQAMGEASDSRANTIQQDVIAEKKSMEVQLYEQHKLDKTVLEVKQSISTIAKLIENVSKGSPDYTDRTSLPSINETTDYKVSEDYYKKTLGRIDADLTKYLELIDNKTGVGRNNAETLRPSSPPGSGEKHDINDHDLRSRDKTMEHLLLGNAYNIRVRPAKPHYMPEEEEDKDEGLAKGEDQGYSWMSDLRGSLADNDAGGGGSMEDADKDEIYFMSNQAGFRGPGASSSLMEDFLKEDDDKIVTRDQIKYSSTIILKEQRRLQRHNRSKEGGEGDAGGEGEKEGKKKKSGGAKKKKASKK